MHRHALRLLMLALALTAICGGRTLVAAVENGSDHVVKPGETLSDISQSSGVPLEQLLALNDLVDPNVLTVGQVVRLRASAGGAGTGQAAGPSPPAGATGAEYIVKPGDTLTSIAQVFGLTFRALADANQLADPDRLVAGQRLVIPGGAANRPDGAPRAAAAPSGGSSESAATVQDSAVALLERLGQRYGVDPALLKAMAWVGNGGRPLPLGRARALGLLEVAPSTFEHVQKVILRRALDPARVEDNAEAGAAYMAALLRRAGEGREPKALATFIQGPGSVQANGIRPATEQQVNAVLALRTRFKQGGAAPPPSGTPAASTESAAPLSERVKMAARTAAGPQGRIGVAGRDLVTGQRLALAADESFPAASVAKLAILAEAYRASEAGRRALTDAIKADLSKMIVVSDNEAANRLLELYGTASVNDAMTALGLTQTRLSNQFGTAAASGPLNRTSPSDMARFFELLATDQVVSPTASREMRSLLGQAQDGSKLRRGLPPEARLAHKSGWFTGVANDAGIVTQGRSTYILAVFTDGVSDAEAANDTIAAIARTVHEAWGPR